LAIAPRLESLGNEEDGGRSLERPPPGFLLGQGIQEGEGGQGKYQNPILTDEEIDAGDSTLEPFALGL
jgi:hypothetical protein